MPALYFDYQNFGRTTPISDEFILRLMPEASGDDVKVYLYVFRAFYHQEASLSTQRIAAALSLSEETALQSLRFWQSKGALSLHSTEEGLTLSFASPKAPGGSDPHPGGPSSDDIKVIRVERMPNYSPQEIELYCQNDTIKNLFREVAALLGAPLSYGNMKVLFGFYDYYRLPVDVILYLVRLCVSGGNRSFRYMEKVAEDWSDRQLLTVDKARAYAERYTKYKPIYRALGAAYRNPSDQEIALIESWFQEYGMTMDMVTEAARRTQATLGKPSLRYADGILRNWHTQGAKTLADVERLDKEREQRLSEAAGRTGKGAKPSRKGPFFAINDNTYHDYDSYEAAAEAWIRQKESEG